MIDSRLDLPNMIESDGRMRYPAIREDVRIPPHILAKLDQNHDDRVHSMSGVATQYEQFRQYVEGISRSLSLCALGATIKTDN